MTSTNEKADLGAVKLACRDLWKIYGVTPREAAEIAGASRNDGNKSTSGSNPVAAVAGATLDIHEAEIFVLMGLSGSGKSTLLRCLTRLIEPSYGSVTFDGEDLLAAGRQRMTEIRRQAMGMVFQNFGLLPHLTVLDNVAFPLRVQGIDRAKREARAREMTELVGLKGREGQYPRELSGGQQQRVGIARSLAAEPEIWFLDEPFSALDPLIRRQMQDEFIRLQKMLRKTIVFVTHDVQEAFRLADRIAIMRDGAIVQIGTPAEIALTPANDYIAEFLRDVPLLKVIRAADVMHPVRGSTRPTRAFSPDDPLEDILPDLLGGNETVGISGPGDTLIGEISSSSISRLLRGDRAATP
ncbi:betaine/proline/choline family ABC transporter ATP-binding protein (plasmid) [Ensifer adhaerens]|uniref:quaternary amine ABC transporter ATP-binding protein n=1 Tax=Ensifer adhaerens TaxID=106592 RepID=UPI001CBB341F|nr:betaine/proline/choline family ABC transporter ATP-binding protein [Ensifer adhaerens]MBZ7927340.1 betaine/proline/choline family ABC transporter ATP-binding protein [Ensifer adhaerens]UAX98349.1 betaine/proline/choline family ABC transporter ATP-binding protein [Ensifer adhaerens]UAY05732.1 betaine/proline/choline family ABC transporter ATP-binding protein [Ensifer adhaerens]UAY13110.1 betaine/proline/choline family ABC transporter ATP-binding protein [Ensifer adhaerens]